MHQAASNAPDFIRHFGQKEITSLEDIREYCKQGEHPLARPEDFVSPERHGCIGSLKSGVVSRWTNMRKGCVKKAEGGSARHVKPGRTRTGDRLVPRAP